MPILLLICTGIVIPGVVAWIALQIKVARLEERVKMHEENHKETKAILEQIRVDLKEIRDKLPR